MKLDKLGLFAGGVLFVYDSATERKVQVHYL